MLATGAKLQLFNYSKKVYTGDNASKILEATKANSLREVEQVVARLKGPEKRQILDKIKPVVLRKTDKTCNNQDLFKTKSSSESILEQNSDFLCGSQNENSQQAVEEKYHFSFSGSKELAEKVAEAKELISGRLDCVTYGKSGKISPKKLLLCM